MERQSPAAGTLVLPSAAIALVIPYGDCVQYPNEIGRDAGAAKQELQSLGFTVTVQVKCECGASTVKQQTPDPTTHPYLRTSGQTISLVADS